MPKTTFELVITCGELRRDVWCDRCQTSAGLEVDVISETPSGEIVTVQTVKRCLRCDYEDD